MIIADLSMKTLCGIGDYFILIPSLFDFEDDNSWGASYQNGVGLILSMKSPLVTGLFFILNFLIMRDENEMS